MKKLNTNIFKCICALLMLFQLSAEAQTYNLVWADEFNSVGPDWVFETGTGSGGWGNNELQYYRRENATTSGGMLYITARRESFGGMNYTSARMKTQGRKSWKYGRIEARMSMPSFQGVWPAFWTLGDAIGSVGWPSCGEIDVMEHVNTGGTVHGTIHWQDHNNTYANYGGSTSTSITAMHTYRIDWTASDIRWFVDGVQYHIASIANGVNGTSEFHANFFILFNLAIGGNWPGFVVDNNAFPANMVVDYVRVYQTGTTPGFTRTTQAESYNAMAGVQTENCSEGGLNVGWIDTGDWMAYNGIALPSSGAYLVEYRVASPNATGRLSLDLNAGAIQLGSLAIPNTGGWQNWRTISHTVNINAGTYNFGIFSQAGGWNINWWRITKTGSGRSEVIAESTDFEKPVQFKTQGFPNPFVGSTKISVDLPEAGHTEVSVFSSVGSKISDLQNGHLTAGKHEFDFNAESMPSGLYIYRVNHNGRQLTGKLFKK